MTTSAATSSTLPSRRLGVIGSIVGVLMLIVILYVVANIIGLF